MNIIIKKMLLIKLSLKHKAAVSVISPNENICFINKNKTTD